MANAMISDAKKQYPNIKVTISIEIGTGNPLRPIFEKRDLSEN